MTALGVWSKIGVIAPAYIEVVDTLCGGDGVWDETRVHGRYHSGWVLKAIALHADTDVVLSIALWTLHAWPTVSTEVIFLKQM